MAPSRTGGGASHLPGDIVAIRTVRNALDLALTIQAPRATDLRLSAAERAQVAENITRVTAVLGDVNVNTNLVAPNRRQAHAATLNDRVGATMQIDITHNRTGETFEAGSLYDALDLMDNCAEAIATGVPTITTVLSGQWEGAP